MLIFLEIYPKSDITYHPNNNSIDITINDDYFDQSAYGNELTYGGLGYSTTIESMV